MTATAPTWPTRLRQPLLTTQAICVLITVMLAIMGMDPVVALVYSLAIGNLNSLLVHLGRWGLTRWQLSRQDHPPTPAQRDGWPGWGPMAPVIVLAVLIAYPLGATLASALLGVEHTWLHGHAWQDWGAPFVISLFPAVAATYYFHTRARLAATEAALAQVARQSAETQLQMLQSQLEPHMLFNTLANLRALIALDPPRAQQMLDHMIAWLRATLGASRLSRHPLSAEFAQAADYLALMRIRMGERLTVRLALPPELADGQVPPLLLQPLVENAIRHGLEPVRGPGTIQLQASAADGVLRLEVIDSGAGLDAQAPTRGTGFGLTQVRERLATLYDTRARLDLLPADGGGTCARIELPLQGPEERP